MEEERLKKGRKEGRNILESEQIKNTQFTQNYSYLPSIKLS